MLPRLFSIVFVCAVCLGGSTSDAAGDVSSKQAVQIATEYLRHRDIDLRPLNVSVQLRREPEDDATDPAVRKKLIHRKHWWVYFTQRSIDVYGGVHSIYIDPATAQVIGWCSER
jgi:hypothetical protein